MDKAAELLGDEPIERIVEKTETNGKSAYWNTSKNGKETGWHMCVLCGRGVSRRSTTRTMLYEPQVGPFPPKSGKAKVRREGEGTPCYNDDGGGGGFHQDNVESGQGSCR